MVENHLNQKRGRIDRLLQKLGGILVDDDRRHRFLTKTGLWMRRILWSVSILYILGVLLIGIIGEGNVLSAYLLYVPPLAWLVPLFPLAFVALFVDRRLLIALCLWTAIYMVSIMGYNFGSIEGTKEPVDGEFTVMTYNRGQRVGSLKPFKRAQAPDILLMQEARWAAQGYMNDPDYGEFTSINSIGEHTIFSRYPVVSRELIGGPMRGANYNMAARFVVDFGDRGKVAVYSVHLPTARPVLNNGFRRTTMTALFGFSGTRLGKEKAGVEAFWRGRVDLTEALLERIENEALPVVAVGDFNMPARGRIYRRVASALTDAHVESGSGYGFTFPGATRNPLALFGPWMRLDYLFSNDKLQPIWSEVEAKRPSQHRAVAARFRFEGS